MSEQSTAEEGFVPEADQPIINDAITAEDAGFSGNAGEALIGEAAAEEAVAEEQLEVVAEGEEVVQADTIEELQEEVQDAIDEGANEEEVKQMIKEFTLKVNGKEVKRSIDLNDHDAVTKELQLAAAGQEAMQKSREIEKAVEKEVERLINEPWKVMEEIGLDPDKLAEERLRAKVEELKKSPDQLEREKMQRELEEARSQLKREQEAREQAKFSQLQQEQAVLIEQEISEALDAHTSLPKSQRTVQRIADAMIWAIDSGYNDVKVADVIPSVEREIKQELSGFLEDLPEQMMEEYIGKKNIERLRQKRLEKVKAAPKNAEVKQTAKSLETKEEKPGKKMRNRDYFKNL